MADGILCDQCRERIPEMTVNADVERNGVVVRVEMELCGHCLGSPEPKIIGIYFASTIEAPGDAAKHEQ